MKHALLRVLWLIVGVLLIAVGVYFIASPGATIASLSLLIGISILISGIVDIIIYAISREVIAGAGWLLADGIITVLLAALLLCNQWVLTAIQPFLFSMWILFSGVAKTVDSFELKRFGVKGWGWFTALGILLIVAGFITFFSPVISIVTIAILVGISLILHGITAVLQALFTKRFMI